MPKGKTGGGTAEAKSYVGKTRKRGAAQGKERSYSTQEGGRGAKNTKARLAIPTGRKLVGMPAGRASKPEATSYVGKTRKRGAATGKVSVTKTNASPASEKGTVGRVTPKKTGLFGSATLSKPKGKKFVKAVMAEGRRRKKGKS